MHRRQVFALAAVGIVVALAATQAFPHSAVRNGMRFHKARHFVARQMRDPYSARFEDVRLGANDKVCGRINAKNAYGAYSGAQEFVWTEGRLSLAPKEPADIVYGAAAHFVLAKNDPNWKYLPEYERDRMTDADAEAVGWCAFAKTWEQTCSKVKTEEGNRCRSLGVGYTVAEGATLPAPREEPQHHPVLAPEVVPVFAPGVQDPR